MNNFNKAVLLSMLLTILLGSTFTFAKVDAEQQKKLTAELTPMGAIRAGNGQGIPAWGETSEIDSNEKPLFIITRDNYQQYAKNLSAGQLALFEHYPDSFKMPVYSSQRTAVAPEWVYKNTADNTLNTVLNQDGTGFENAKSGIPFAIPASALEVYFNHVSRWRGQQLENTASDAVVYKKGNFTLTTRRSLVRFDGYINENDSKYFISIISKTLAPATKAGGGVLVLEPLDQLNEKRAAWLWDKGRRRVIRAPNIAYDSPVESSAAIRTVDDTDLISGSPDRFDWQLLEKREIYIPYNNDKLSDNSLKYKNILHKHHINPELSRYELHRVWVLRATLKKQWRHVYSRRDFYLDEDSWQVVIADQYNKAGDLWRVSLSYPKFYPQMPGVFPVINVFHDLISQKYHVMGLQNEEHKGNVFNGELAKDSLFTPSGFKRFVR